ncbi:helix-turn-helix domain-containing protein [Kitasatospora sp. MBT63]|uniref:helix-turn-helix domain-containing protein n=1 Tax=Kitasatospora sp. MBT63 TaxID=1444768 RepID=UPI00053A0F72|nr:helix-turn-helix domain-containing protein [Kitasatospora sp. MBT63]
MTGARTRTPPPGYLTTQQITALGVPAATVRDWVRRGRLTAAPGGTVRYPWYRTDDVLPLIEARAVRRRDAA